jgi:hypothetical protein
MKNLDVKLNQVLSMLKESKEEKTNVNKSASASATAAANATVQKAQQKN